ncbi:hypothetical protein PRIPAC_91084 [Pristionchus pacificus]|uniref:Uncharacterized protein n=1 Tax=Pristionchus pacificus TaxID=54126 RepID=A0A2A6CXF7_PRIPA|nr:hypothetical protein PRIPAC_91084 [Pristionchus pacificus]|eukprot:PDM82902.1 hypothetical protein PRIPAC_37295 [Pristionchus pacificus]
MPVLLPFFDGVEFFNNLTAPLLNIHPDYLDFVIRENDYVLPDWNTSRYHIDRFFTQLTSQLLIRVKIHIDFKSPAKAPTPKRFDGEPFNVFEYRRHDMLLGYYCYTAAIIGSTIWAAKHSGRMQQYKLEFLDEQMRRLFVHLEIIKHIFKTRSSIDLSQNLRRENQENRPVILRSIVDIAPGPRCEPVQRNSCGKKTKNQLTTTKTLLELKKDRRRFTSISTFSDSLQLKKKAEIESTDEEDFDSYAKDIFKMASYLAEDEDSSAKSSSVISSDSQKYNTFFESITAFGNSEQTLAAVSPSSKDCDADLDCLDAFEKKLEMLIEEKNQKEADQMNGDTFDSVDDVDWEDEFALMAVRSKLAVYGRWFA